MLSSCSQPRGAAVPVTRHGVRGKVGRDRPSSLSASSKLRRRAPAAEAGAWVSARADAPGVLIVSASRGAADDLARAVAMARGGAIGLHRFSFAQLAARLAAPVLAARGVAPATFIGAEAVAARATFEARATMASRTSRRWPARPVSRARWRGRCTSLMLAARATRPALGSLPLGGPDLAALLERFDEQFAAASATDRAALFEAAAEAAGTFAAFPLLLLDVPLDSAVEFALVAQLIAAAPDALITVPFGDLATLDRLKTLGRRSGGARAGRRRPTSPRSSATLFATRQPPEREPTGDVRLFSAPGEGRECVEIARRILARGARRRAVRRDGGLPALAARLPRPARARVRRAPASAPGSIAALAGRIPRAARSSRCSPARSSACRPSRSPSTSRSRRCRTPGRARRPQTPAAACRRSARRLRRRRSAARRRRRRDDRRDARGRRRSTSRTPVVAGDAARAVEVGEADRRIGGDRRRPGALAPPACAGSREQYRQQMRRRAQREDPDSPRLARIERDARNLAHLRAFALPIVDALASWPATRDVGRVARRASRARAARAAPAGARAARARRAAADGGHRSGLARGSARRPRRSAAHARRAAAGRPLRPRVRRQPAPGARPRRSGSSSCPGWPSGCSRRSRARIRCCSTRRCASRSTRGCRSQDDRAQDRAAAAAARGRRGDRAAVAVVSAPRRRRRAAARAVVLRARRHARDHRAHPRSRGAAAAGARATGGAKLDWPAPADAGRRDRRPRARPGDAARADRRAGSARPCSGHAHYLLGLNDALRRSVTRRWARAQIALAAAGRPRPRRRRRSSRCSTRSGSARGPYSLSALQKFATCPYQFLLVGDLPPRAERRAGAAAAARSADARRALPRGRRRSSSARCRRTAGCR